MLGQAIVRIWDQALGCNAELPHRCRRPLIEGRGVDLLMCASIGASLIGSTLSYVQLELNDLRAAHDKTHVVSSPLSIGLLDTSEPLSSPLPCLNLLLCHGQPWLRQLMVVQVDLTFYFIYRILELGSRTTLLALFTVSKMQAALVSAESMLCAALVQQRLEVPQRAKHQPCLAVSTGIINACVPCRSPSRRGPSSLLSGTLSVSCCCCGSPLCLGSARSGAKSWETTWCPSDGSSCR